MRRTSLVVLIVAVGLVLGACGSSSNTSSATSTTLSGSAEATVPPADKDKAKAQATVLTQADVGAGYKPAAPGNSADRTTPEADKAFKDCSQNNPVLNNDSEERSAESEFEKGELMSVNSSVEFWTNEADFKAAMDILASDAFAVCLDGAFTRLFAELGGTEAATISNVKTVKKAVTAAGADQATGLTTTLTVTVGPVRVNLFMDMIFMRKGRAGAFLMTMSGQQAFPSAESERLKGILAQRLVANAG